MNIIEWRDNLLESRLNYKAKYLGLILSQFYRRGKPTYPSIRTLSSLSGLTVNPVQQGITTLIAESFITRDKKRLGNDRYLSNIYTFVGVAEIEHVSRGDVSPHDTSPRDTSNDTSNDTSPRDTEVDKEDKVERERLTKEKIKNLSFEGRFRDITNKRNLPIEVGMRCFEKWKIKRAAAPPEDLYGDFEIWCLNERIDIVRGESPEKPLEGEDLKIQQLGTAAWRRRNKMTLMPEQQRMLEAYEKLNSEVWWDNIRQHKEGRK